MSAKHDPLRYAHDEGHTDVCFSSDGDKIITVGADGDIRIWPRNESEDPVHNCIGEWALSVRQKGKHIYVTTSSNDVQILTYPEGERDGVLDRFVSPINHIAIAKNSDVIALAAEEMEIKLIDLNRSDKEISVFSGMTGPCLSVALSPDSEKLSASSGDGKLRIWNTENKTLLKEIDCFPKVNSFSNAKQLCRMDFEPTKGEKLAYPDNSTVVILDVLNWSEVKTLSTDTVSASYSIVQYSPCGKYLVATSDEGDFVVWNVAAEAVCDYSVHPKHISISGLMWDPLGSGKIVYTDVEGQLGSMLCELKSSGEEKEEKTEIGDGFAENEVDFGEFQFEDDDEDNENAISVEKLKKQYMDSEEPELKLNEASSSRSSTPRPRTPETPLQAPFMPSCTPEHLDPRYLCWNEVGIIRCYGSMANDEDAVKSIEVEFHDSTFHNSMMLQNYQEYTMGSLSKASLVVANSSQLTVIPLNASTKEWMLKMEETEEIILVASSENLVCFALSNYIVRVASTYGTQRAVLSVPGPVVCLAAHKNFLMIAYHGAGVRKGDQCISIKLVKFEGTTLESREIGSALGPASTLLWLGFSDIGTPALMDSLGMLSLFPHTCNTWIPFCDTAKHRKSVSDGFFVTAVFESYQAVGGIKCRGSIYPPFTPHPTMCELPLEPPFAEASTDKTQMETNLFTWSTIQVYDTQKKFKETALKVFALACKNDLDQRALEFMEILSNSQIMTLGARYATKLEKRRLAEKLTDLANKISNDCDDSLGVWNNECSTPDTTTIKPMNRRLTLSATKYSQKNKHSHKEKTSEISATSEFPEQSSNINGTNHDQTMESSIDTQESLFREEEPKNPFLKSLKKPKRTEQNPLSLLDRYAGYNVDKDTKENKQNADNSEKRKPTETAETPTDKPKDKQRRLDKFMFSKQN